jgi:hypothetical protein
VPDNWKETMYPTADTIRRAWQTHGESKMTCAMSGDDAARAQSDYVPAAEAACDFPVTCDFPEPENVPFRETILHEAAQITSCDRNKTYGPPRANHSRTASLWSAYLSGLNGRSLDYRDVCWLNVLQKASRDVFYRQRDNLTDGAGFLRNIEMADSDEGR